MEKKYRRLVKQLSYVNSEYEYVVGTLKDAHIEFEKYYRNYCAENNVPIDELNKNNQDRLNKVYPKAEQKVDENGLVKTKKSDKDEEPIDKTLQKMYKKAAVKIHPDKFSNVEKTPEVESKIEMFKTMASAYDERKWSDFLDICEKLDILPSRYSKVMEIMKKEIDILNNKIFNHKKQFSWMLFECDDDKNCKDGVIKNFLLSLFNYTVKESTIRI
jgi:hypothetical protein